TKWFQNPTTIGSVVAIMGVIITIIIWRFPTKESDFSISVSPILGSIQKPGNVEAIVDIRSMNGYNFPVILNTQTLPYGVIVEFVPKYGNTDPGYESCMTVIAGADAQEGYYFIEIIGNGGDGKEHICKYNLSVETPPPHPPNVSYTVFNDFGIASGDIQSWSGADFGNESPRLIEGNYVVHDAPEGNKCFATTTGAGNSNYAGWGVFLGVFENHKLVTSQTIDLREYNNLQFWIKSMINLKVELQEKGSNERKSSACFIRDFGWENERSNEWQKIVIPANSFRNVDFEQIWCPFMITGVGSNITFLVDDVSWNP
ncbi:hypothetical protein IH575_01895, partial [Candidatus Dojkabacteria bacterium]|nr:hypothetical protein [Candidatus Dojkabacteria bacterium]